MWVQGMPVHGRMSACPQPLSLLMPGPRNAYHRDCAEYRPIPGGGPVVNPASHRGKVVHAGDHQVNHYYDERVPPGEERTPPSAGQRVCCTPPNLARTLLLCRFTLRRALHVHGTPRETGCTTSPGVHCPSLGGAMAHVG